MTVLLIGCSGGTQKQTASPTTGVTTTTTAVRTTLPPARIDANLAYCPAEVPNISLTAVNAGVVGLDAKLVPIAALRVRVCQYSSVDVLAGGGVLLPPLAGQFESLTNNLKRIAEPRGPIGCPGGYPMFLLTFSSNTQLVALVESGCGQGVTNGSRNGSPTGQWLGEVGIFTAKPGTPLRRFRALFVRY